MSKLDPYPGSTPIHPDDIRVGDTIDRLRGDDADAPTVSLRFTVASIDEDGDFWSEYDGAIARRRGSTFYLIDRPGPKLPTEPGSVITDATIQGVRGLTAVLGSTGDWRAAELVDGKYWHHPTEITAWTPAKVVADGEPVTR